VRESGTTLTDLFGIGGLFAGKILARVGSIHRFSSAAAFASYTGTAPIAVSSGDVVRHRLSRAGDRQLNYALQGPIFHTVQEAARVLRVDAATIYLAAIWPSGRGHSRPSESAVAT
jgi:transposase